MTCTCSTQNQSCQHAKQRVNGYYCELYIPKSERKQIGHLQPGDKFYFDSTPYNIHNVKMVYNDSVSYIKPDGWIISCLDVTKVVNKII